MAIVFETLLVALPGNHPSYVYSNETIHSAFYLGGRYPPNYPVPATFGAVQITRYAVYFPKPQGWDCEHWINRQS